MRLVLLGDTHGQHDDLEVPDGDLLIHAGDFCSMGLLAEVQRFGRFLARQPHTHKIVVAGNHDFPFEETPDAACDALGDVHYLCDEGVELDGVRIWGSPWQPEFLDWAFNLPRGDALREVWARIPPDIDLLITHGPPHGILDETLRGEHVGCEQLLERVLELRPRLHVFGHIHEARGQIERAGIRFANISNCDVASRLAHPVTVIDFE